MRRIDWVLSGLVVCLVCLFPVLGAANGILVNVPTADLTKDGRLVFGFQDIANRGEGEVSWGISPEVAAKLSVTKLDGKAGKFDAGVKVQLLKESVDYPAVSFEIAGNSKYLVASKSLGVRAPRIHAGIGQGRVNGVFVGLSYVVNPVTISSGTKSWSVPVAMVMGEFDGKHLNAGIRLAFSPRFDLDLYLVDMEELGWGVKFNTQF